MNTLLLLTIICSVTSFSYYDKKESKWIRNDCDNSNICVSGVISPLNIIMTAIPIIFFIGIYIMIIVFMFTCLPCIICWWPIYIILTFFALYYMLMSFHIIIMYLGLLYMTFF